MKDKHSDPKRSQDLQSTEKASQSAAAKLVGTPSEDDKIHELQKQADELTDLMEENMSLVLQRGNQLQKLNAKTQTLQDTTSLFHHTARRLRWYEELNNMLRTIVAAGAVLGMTYGIVQGFSLTSIVSIGIACAAVSYVMSRGVLSIFHWLQDRAQVLDPKRQPRDRSVSLEPDLSAVLDPQRSLTTQLDHSRGSAPNIVPFKSKAQLEAEEQRRNNSPHSPKL